MEFMLSKAQPTRARDGGLYHSRVVVRGRGDGEEGEACKVGGELKAWQLLGPICVTLIRSSSSPFMLLSPQESV
jgi:hypothetical protein